MNDWQLQTAKNKLSEVVDRAQHDAPQIITRHGTPVVVVLSMSDYCRLTVSQGKLSVFFRESPLADANLDLSRDSSLPREALEL